VAGACWRNKGWLKLKTYFNYLMKKNQVIFFIFLVLSFAGCRSKNPVNSGTAGNQVADTSHAGISFAEYEHKFGKVNAGEKIACIFTFTNTGTSDLVINAATTSCGCTVSKYNRKPILPGNTGTLEVVFNTSGYNGLQTKTITVHSNANVPVVLLRIVAEVINSDNN
jgi:hypothetical protein